MKQFSSKRIYFIALFLCLSTTSFCQFRTTKDTAIVVTFISTKIKLQALFKSTEEQSQFKFGYTQEDLDNKTFINLPGNQLSVGVIINLIKTIFNVYYTIGDGFIIFGKDPNKNETDKEIEIRYPGQVLDIDENPLGGVIIKDIGSGNPATVSDAEGRFTFKKDDKGRLLEFSFKGYESQTIRTVDKSMLTLIMKPSYNTLNEVMITAPTPTTRRNNTAAVGSVMAQELPRGYSSNFVVAMQNKVPGLLITEASGTPGSTPLILIRGRQSIGITPGLATSNNPLFLVNGAVWQAPQRTMSRLYSMAGDPESGGPPGGTSALDAINPADIEKVEVLKDAEATAIYGSRGANGVISIWTRKGAPGGAMKFSVKAAHGIAFSAFKPKMMNTAQFEEMIREGLANDGIPVNEKTAPPLFLWPLNRSTDWSDYTIGNTARTRQYHASASGGMSSQFSIYCGAGFQEETLVLPTQQSNQLITFNINASYIRSIRSSTQFSLIVSRTRYQLPAIDPMPYIRLAPNAPAMRDEQGRLRFEENGLPFTNIDAQLLNTYESRVTSTIASLYSEHALFKKWNLKVRLAANNMLNTEESRYPIAANPPRSGATGTIEKANATNMSLSADQQLQYLDTAGARKISIVIGASMLTQSDNYDKIVRSGFKNDQLMGLTEEAPVTKREGNESLYRYAGLYGAFNATFLDRYILNLTARYDGSSQFGPEQRFALFGALGAGCIFTTIPWIKKRLPFIKFGKLRASIGTAGNDNVGHYTYKDGYQAVTDGLTYAGIQPIKPTQLSNPSLGWEQNLKREMALEAQCGKNLALTIAWYKNTTSRQLITASLPSQTGTAALRGVNHSAAVQNSGIEIWLEVTRELGHRNSLSTELTLTLPRNRVTYFENLENSIYYKTIRTDKSLTEQYALLFEKTDPVTGLYTITNVAGSPEITMPEDFVPIGHMDPIVYGSISNRVAVKQWEFTLLVDARHQYLLNPNILEYLRSPGSLHTDLLDNKPVYLSDRWQKPGDIASYQRFSARPDSRYSTAISQWMSSDEMRKNGSYLRLR